jgi:GNAT superfamily N-acetyltransferase
MTICELDAAAARKHGEELAGVLCDCVDGGASVSFMWPFDMSQARRYWADVATAAGEGRARLYGAFHDGTLGGTVQLWLDTPPNQRHRGDIRKLLVHRSVRRLGMARQLMGHAESAACRLRLTLLTLDTATASPAEHLYQALGWQRIGIIPRYALWPDGRFCDTTFLYKEIAPV